MSTKTVYVDFDGTVVDVMPRYYSILNTYATSLGLNKLDYHDFILLKRRASKDHEIIYHLCNCYEIDVEHYLAYKRSNLEKMSYLKKDIIIGNPDETYHKLKALGYDVVLITQRRSRINLMKELSYLKLLQAFDDVIVLHPSIKENVKLKYLEKVVCKEDIIIGDSKIEIDAAESLNIAGYFVRTGLFDESIFDKEINVINDYASIAEVLAINANKE